MIISSLNKSFELIVKSYEYPNHFNNKYDYWDSNWLMINCNIVDGKNTWSFIEPCFTTFEINNLIEWFIKIDTNDYSKTDIMFVEPLIKFEVLKDNLRLRLSGESKPKWFTSENDYIIDFMLNDINFKLISEQLRSDSKNFPER